MAFKSGIKIDKDFILSHVSEEEIFEKYFTPVIYGQNVLNYNRLDKDAGCRFYVNKTTGRIRFKDFGQGHNWDCFAVAQQRTGLSFKQVLLKIAEDFRLIEVKDGRFNIRQNLTSTPNGLDQRKLFANEIKKKTIKIIGARQSFKWMERKFWSQFSINDKILIKFYVYGFEKAFIITHFADGTTKTAPIYHSRTELKFAYYLGGGEWKLYYPERPKSRIKFIQVNGTILQGWPLLPETGKRLVFTKSYKDVMSFYALDKIPSTATQSENILIPKKIMKEARERFEDIYILYDNDIAGMRAAVKNIIAYPFLKPLLFPKGRPKDLSDNIEKFGINTIRKDILPLII